VRKALEGRAIVIWLQAGAKRIKKHLARAKVSRPEFAEGLHREKVQSMLDTRDPLYKAAATIVIPASIPFAKQVPTAMLELQKHGLSPHPRR